MQKKVLSILLIIVVVATTLVCLVACNKQDISSDLAEGSYPIALTSLMDSQTQQAINQGIREDATQDEKKSAVIALFNIANKSRIETPTSLVLQESDAGISGGTVLMHAFTLRDGDKWFYQLATQVDIGNPVLNEIMSMFAGFLKVGYSVNPGEIYYFNEIGPQFGCDCTLETFPFATYSIPDNVGAFETPLTQDEYKVALHYLNSQFEINNMKFCEEIIADDPIITYDEQGHFYTVEFAVDMDADATMLAEWFALPKEDMAVGGQTLEKYNYYTAKLQVWDNGYAKSFESHADRSAGLGSGAPVDRFEYLWLQDEIMGLLHQDERIDVTLYDEEDWDEIVEYINYYSNPVFVQPSNKLGVFEIFGIIVGCIVFVIIAIVVTIEVLVKKGKLPKLAAKREAKKQKRLAKKATKKTNAVQADDVSDVATASAGDEQQDVASDEENSIEE